MSDKFDELARAVAGSLTRWQALRSFGTGLSGVLLLTSLGWRINQTFSRIIPVPLAGNVAPTAATLTGTLTGAPMRRLHLPQLLLVRRL